MSKSVNTMNMKERIKAMSPDLSEDILDKVIQNMNNYNIDNIIALCILSEVFTNSSAHDIIELTGVHHDKLKGKVNSFLKPILEQYRETRRR